MERTQSTASDRATGKLPGAESRGDWDHPGARSCDFQPGAAQSVGQQIKGAATELTESASEVAGEVKSKVQEAAQVAASKAEETKQAAGEQMHTLAGKIREGGEVVSEKAEQIGTYLQEHDFSAIGRDVTEIIRRYPVQALLIGIGLGVLLGRSAR